MVKHPPTNVGDTRDMGSIPGLGRSPGEGNGNPLQYSCLGNSKDREAWQARVHGVKESDTTEHRSTYEGKVGTVSAESSRGAGLIWEMGKALPRMWHSAEMGWMLKGARGRGAGSSGRETEQREPHVHAFIP